MGLEKIEPKQGWYVGSLSFSSRKNCFISCGWSKRFLLLLSSATIFLPSLHQCLTFPVVILLISSRVYRTINDTQNGEVLPILWDGECVGLVHCHWKPTKNCHWIQQKSFLMYLIIVLTNSSNHNETPFSITRKIFSKIWIFTPKFA